MYNPLEIRVKLPRIYLALHLFGWEFSVDLGWFKADIQGETWRFGPELILLAKLDGEGWLSYWSSIGFSAFTRKLMIETGMTKYDY